MDIKELEYVDPQHHWYYQTKLTAVHQAILTSGWQGGSIVDIGAGSGFFAQEILRGCPQERAFCVDPHYSPTWLGSREQLTFTREISPDQIREASLMLFLDVLEHVPDDRELLRSYSTNASPGTLVAITVPAFMSMWSGHDVFLEHFRRYRRPEVAAVAQSAGLRVLTSRYLYGSLFPAVWLSRKLRQNNGDKSDMRQPISFVNQGLQHLFTTEHRIPWNPLFGLTVLLIAQVPIDPGSKVLPGQLPG